MSTATTVSDLFRAADAKLKSLSKAARDDLFGEAIDFVNAANALPADATQEELDGEAARFDALVESLGLSDDNNLFSGDEWQDAANTTTDLLNILRARVPQEDAAALKSLQDRLNAPPARQPSPVKQPSPTKAAAPAAAAPGTRTVAPATRRVAPGATVAKPAAAPAPAARPGAPTKVGAARPGIARASAAVPTATVARPRGSGDKTKARDVAPIANRVVTDLEKIFWYSNAPGHNEVMRLDEEDKAAVARGELPLDRVTRSALIAKAVKKDLYEHYHHEKKISNALFARNREIIGDINGALKKFYLCFGRYGEDATFHLSAAGKESTVPSEYLKINKTTVAHLESMRDIRLSVEQYWFEGKHAKSGAAGGAQLKSPVILTEEAKKWFDIEPLTASEGRTVELDGKSYDNLKDYLVAATGARNYNSTFLGKGFVITSNIASIARLATGGSIARTAADVKAFADNKLRADAKYAWSAAAKEALSARSSITYEAEVDDKGVEKKRTYKAQPRGSDLTVLAVMEAGTTKKDKDGKALPNHITADHYWGSNVAAMPSYLSYSAKTPGFTLTAEQSEFLRGANREAFEAETKAIAKFSNALSIAKSRQEDAEKKAKSY